MTQTLKLGFPVMTLDRKELLAAGALLTPHTMDELVRSAQSEEWPLMRLMEYGTVAGDLQRFCKHPPYDRIFSNPTQTRAIFDALQKMELVQPLLEVYGYLKIHAPYTYQHILIVSALSLLLAMELADDRSDLTSVASAAQHHDIGKICIPRSIRKKTTMLTDGERHHLSHHSAAGYVLLSYYYQNPNHPSALTARDHHERSNASGYPRGISQQDRIIEIVAVGDLFDALISPRPYRPSSFDLRTALEEITCHAISGALNNDVVSVLISLNRAGRPHYKDCKLSPQRRGTPPVGNMYRGAACLSD